jgi:hypothetical protein
MEWIAIIALGAIVIAGVALLWRSAPQKPAAESDSEQDQKRDVMVDVTPPGGGPP